MNQQMFPVFLGLMIISTAAWFFLTKRLIQHLKANHADIYESLGNPELSAKRGGLSNILVIRYILFEHKSRTNDPVILKLCQGLVSLLIIFAICLFGCVLLLMDFAMH